MTLKDNNTDWCLGLAQSWSFKQLSFFQQIRGLALQTAIQYVLISNFGCYSLTSSTLYSYIFLVLLNVLIRIFLNFRSGVFYYCLCCSDIDGLFIWIFFFQCLKKCRELWSGQCPLKVRAPGATRLSSNTPTWLLR